MQYIRVDTIADGHDWFVEPRRQGDPPCIIVTIMGRHHGAYAAPLSVAEARALGQALLDAAADAATPN